MGVIDKNLGDGRRNEPARQNGRPGVGGDLDEVLFGHLGVDVGVIRHLGRHERTVKHLQTRKAQQFKH